MAYLKPNITVDRVSDLSSITRVRHGDIVNILGHYNPNDGGGQLVSYDRNSSLTQNNGSVFNGPGGVGRFKTLNSEANVKCFGAKGDGSNDDTSFIQIAINSSFNTVYFPAGTYVVSNVGGVLCLNYGDNIRLHGEGIGVSTLKLQDNESISNSRILSSDQARSNVYVEHLTIDGNRANYDLTENPGEEQSAGFFSWVNSSNINLIDCEFKGCQGDGVRFSADGARIENCIISDNYRVGINLHASSNTVVTENVIKDSDIAVKSELNSGDIGMIGEGIVIHGNEIHANQCIAFNRAGAVNSYYRNVTVSDNALFTLDDTSSGASGPFQEGGAKRALFIRGVKGGAVSGNTFVNGTDAGFMQIATDNRDITFSSNVMRDQVQNLGSFNIEAAINVGRWTTGAQNRNLVFDSNVIENCMVAIAIQSPSNAKTGNFTVDTANDELDASGHGVENGDIVEFTTTGTLPAGLSLSTEYFVTGVADSGNSFQVSTSLTGTAVSISDTGSGTHTFTQKTRAQDISITNNQLLEVAGTKPTAGNAIHIRDAERVGIVGNTIFFSEAATGVTYAIYLQDLNYAPDQVTIASNIVKTNGGYDTLISDANDVTFVGNTSLTGGSGWFNNEPGGTLITNGNSPAVASSTIAKANVVDYGADNTGATDSTSAIQSAFNSGANDIYFPAGTYKVTKAVGAWCIKYSSHMLIRGDGIGASTVRLADGESTSQSRIFSTDAITSGVEFRDLTIDGNRANWAGSGTETSSDGLFVWLDSKDIRVINCEFKGCQGDGARVRTENIHISNCVFSDNYRYGLNVHAPKHAKIVNNVFEDTGVGLFMEATSSDTGILAEGNIVANNSFRALEGITVNYAGAANTRFENLVIANNSFYMTNSGSSGSSGAFETTVTKAGITLRGVKGGSIIGNLFTNASDEGAIFLEGENRDITINDNVIKDQSQDVNSSVIEAAINVGRTSTGGQNRNITIDGNVIDNCMVAIGIQTPTSGKSGNFTAATSDVLTSSNHGLENGDIVTVSSTGTLPSPLDSSLEYFVQSVDDGSDTFKVSQSITGTVVDITDAGSGTHSFTQKTRPQDYKITNNVITEVGGTKPTATYALQIRDIDNCLIDGNIIKFSEAATGNKFALYLQNSNFSPTDVTFSNNILYTIGSYDLLISDATNFSLISNVSLTGGLGWYSSAPGGTLSEYSNVPASSSQGQALQDLSDVCTDSPSTDEVLTWDGAEWCPGVNENEKRWTLIDSSKYTSTPTSTTQIAMSDTSDMHIGLPLRYRYSGTTWYGIVTNVAANSWITLRGATLDTGAGLTELSVGTNEMVSQMNIFIAGQYADGLADLIASDMNSYVRWQQGDGYAVKFSVAHKTPDSGAEPTVNVKINGSFLSTEDSFKGPTLSSSAGTWTNCSTTVNTNNYKADMDDDIEVRCTQAGGSGDAADLSVSIVFVLE